MLSRRDLLKGIVATGVVAGLDNLVSTNSLIEAETKRVITIDDALSDISVREQYVIQLLKQLFGEDLHKYIENVYYDHDMTKAENTPIYGSKKRDREVFKRMPAAILVDWKQYGKGKKADLYVFRGFFEAYSVKGNGGSVIVHPTGARFKAVLEHEFIHAKDYFNGIILENRLVIDNLNYPKINPYVRVFVEESRGLIKQIEVSRKLEKLPIIDLNSYPLEKLPSSYIDAMTRFYGFLETFEKHLKPEVIPFSEVGYIVNQLNQIKRKVPEVSAWKVVQNLYQRFGIKW